MLLEHMVLNSRPEALQVICAVLLTAEEVIIENVPQILDVMQLIDLLRAMGVRVEQLAEDKYLFQAADVNLDYLTSEDYRRHQGVRHPRTVVALSRSNKLLLITIDGRSKNSAGMSAKETTEFLIEYFNQLTKVQIF